MVAFSHLCLSNPIFGPHLPACLPTDDPFWWSDAELQLLQGTRLHKAVAHYTNSLQQLHEWLLRLEQIHQQHLLQQQQQEQQEQQQQQGSTLATARGGWGLTYDAIKWSRSAVWSRAFTVKGLDIGSSNNVAGTAVRHTKEQVECDAQLPTAAPPAAGAARQGCGEGIAPVIALVPVLDMCDHHPQQRVSWRTVRQAQQHQQQHSTGQQDKCEEQQRGLQSFQMTSLSPVTKVSCVPLDSSTCVSVCSAVSNDHQQPLLQAFRPAHPAHCTGLCS